jgi:hypothetical protein
MIGLDVRGGATVHRYAIVCLLLLLVGLPAWSATLEEARRLQEAGQTDEALSIVEELLGSQVTGDETAAALDLLGSIAVDKGYLPMAKQAWAQLVEEYPDYAVQNDVETKLRLVSALLRTATTPPAEPSSPALPVTEVPATTPAEPPAPVLPAPSPAPTPAVADAEKKPVAPPQQASGLVLIAGRGRPYDAVVETNQRIVAFLRERGVDAVSSTGDVPVVESSGMVLPFLLQKGREEKAASVLLLTADYMRVQKVISECYSPEGAELWKVKASGGTGVKGRPYSETGVTEALLERFLERLEKQIGGPGLPVTLR